MAKKVSKKMTAKQMKEVAEVVDVVVEEKTPEVVEETTEIVEEVVVSTPEPCTCIDEINTLKLDLNEALECLTASHKSLEISEGKLADAKATIKKLTRNNDILKDETKTLAERIANKMVCIDNLHKEKRTMQLDLDTTSKAFLNTQKELDALKETSWLDRVFCWKKVIG